MSNLFETVRRDLEPRGSGLACRLGRRINNGPLDRMINDLLSVT